MDEIILNPVSTDPLPPSPPAPVAPRRGPWDWLKEQPNFPSTKLPGPIGRPSFLLQFLGRWFRPRLFLSTWLILFLTGAALFLLEIPGRRTGFTTYAHGWPFVYLNRDYWQDLKLDDWYGPDFGYWESTIGGQQWINTDPAAMSNWHQEIIAHTGLLLEYERRMTPWSVAGTIAPLNAIAASADVALAMLLLLAVGWVAQRWRRRRIAAGNRAIGQFRLRTLLLGTTILGSLFALVVSWARAYRNDQLLASVIKTEGHLSEDQLESHWLPPPIVPESVIKIGGIAKWFERLDTAIIDGDFGTDPPPRPSRSPFAAENLPPRDRTEFSDAIASLIVRVPKLRRLDISDMILTEPGLARLTDATSISELSLCGSGITAAGVKQLARLPNLTKLSLEGFGVNNEVLAQLNDLQSLEQLTIYRTTASLARLHALWRLQSLYIDCFGYPGPGDQPPFREIALMNPANVPEDGVWHPEVELENLPELKHLVLTGATIDKAGAQAIGRLPAIETLSMTDCKGGEQVPLAIDGREKLTTVAIGGAALSEIRLENLPRLAEAEISPSDKLSRLRLAHLPRLRSVRLDAVPSLAQVDISDAENLSQLTLSPLQGFVPSGCARTAEDRPVRLGLHGLSQLSGLTRLALPDRKLSPSLLDDVGRLTGLVSLDLSGTWLTDNDLARLVSLVNLEQLDLSGTDITADGLESLKNMRRLQRLDLTNSLVANGDAGLERRKLSHPNLAITLQKIGSEYDWLKDAVDATDNGDALWNSQKWFPWIEVTDRMLDSLRGINWLPNINLRNCHVTDAGLERLKTQVYLQSLNLAGTRITDAGLARLSCLKNLESLGLADTLIQGAGIKQLQNLPALKALDLSGCDLSDDDLANLRFLPNLERLWLADTQITDTGLAHLALLPKLREIDVSRTAVTDAGLAHLIALAQLELFVSRGCPIDGSGVHHLQRLQRLSKVDLSDTRLNPAGLEQLTHLTQLQRLVLEGIVVPDAIGKRLPALKHIAKWSSVGIETIQESVARSGARSLRLRDLQIQRAERAETCAAFWPGLYPPVDGD